MTLSKEARAVLEAEARGLLTRVANTRPFSVTTPTVLAASVPWAAHAAIERHLMNGRVSIRRRVTSYLRWLRSESAARSGDAEAQRRLAFLRLQFNATLHQFDIFADVFSQRAETDNGMWLSGLDRVAADALELKAPYFEAPPLVTYLDRGHGAAIRRARTRLPGGGENPVAVIRIPRERMVGSGIASSLVHEVGHQGAALLGLVASLRPVLEAKATQAEGADQRQAWALWERWISEILADLWSVAKVGVAATAGLVGVVSLPRPFVFRIQLDDPHPFPWIRVKLSAAAGQAFYPDRQWSSLDRLWEAFYPRAGLDAKRLGIIAALEATLPEFLSTVLGHRPPKLRGATLREVLGDGERNPQRLRSLHTRWRKNPRLLRRAPPTLSFAMLGQAKHDGRLGPEEESRVLMDLLRRWAFDSAFHSRDATAGPRSETITRAQVA